MIVKTARWFISLNRKIFNIAPAISLMVTLLTLISQIAVILAFLLPLKVILMMASDRIPGYFPEFMQAYERDALIIWLGMIAIGLYFFYLALTAVIERLYVSGVATASRKNAKLFLRSDQTKTMQTAYKQVTKMQADALFVLLSVPVIAYVYPALALFLIVGLILLLCGLLWGSGLSAFHSVLKTTGTQVLFLLAFAFMVIDFLHGGLPDRYAALVSVILSRQVLNRFGAAAISFSGLLAMRSIVDATYFHGIAYEPKKAGESTSFWQLEPGKGKPDAEKQINDFLGGFEGAASGKRTLTTANQNAALGFFIPSKNHAASWLLKIYEPQRIGAWTREKELLEALGSSTADIFPKLDTFGDFRDGKLLLLAMRDTGKPVVLRKQSKAERIFLLQNLWSVSPPANLLAKYHRSHPFKYELLKGSGLERLEFVCRLSGQSKAFEEFSQVNLEVQASVSRLPLVFVNPRMKNSLVKAGTKITCVDWSGWSIEPAGSGWQFNAWSDQELSGMIANLANQREEFTGKTALELQKAGAMYDMSIAFERRRWADAVQAMLFVNRLAR